MYLRKIISLCFAFSDISAIRASHFRTYLQVPAHAKDELFLPCVSDNVVTALHYHSDARNKLAVETVMQISHFSEKEE
jgi:hypothetical protein